MNCAKCGHGNPEGTKFCGECGARLLAACPSCGAAVSPANKFCGQCGAPLRDASAARAPGATPPRHLAERILESREALEGERKQVTVLFVDIKGSMELLADRDPEEARRLLDPVLERMMEAVHAYEGTVNQVMGDGIMALFGAPLAHEDHALRACYAALRMQDAIRRYSETTRAAQGIEIQARVGLNSGEVIVRSIGSDLRMDYTAVGQTTHLAARMEQLATPGTIRLTGDTAALVEGYVTTKPIGPIPVKGLARPVEVAELTGAVAIRTRMQAARARGLTRFVGRDPEMQLLRAAAEETRRGRGQVVAVVGEPGVGKSRLYYEFVQAPQAREFLVLESGSVSYGKATPFLPLADLLRNYFKVAPSDDVRAIRVKVTGGLLTLDEALKDVVPVALWLLDALPDESPFLALGPSERRRQTLAAVKRILLRENEVRPLLLVFEDLHWIDGETQAFLDSFVDSVPASRVLLAVNYRPEYRHAWASKTYYRQLRVDPLPAQSAEDLLAGLLGSDPGMDALKRLLIARTEGRPLFLEESVRMLVEAGALAGEPGSYRLARAVESLQLPATVQAILAARIDRLEPRDKRLLQAAAVVGTNVPFPVLQAIAEMDDDELRAALGRLQTAEFLYEARIFPELEYAFKHALTHEVAYGSVLEERRVSLHKASLEAIERIYAGRQAEHIERLAHHAVSGRVHARAIHYLKEAGARAMARSANREAVAFYEQALALLARPEAPDAAGEELEIRLALGPAVMELKGPGSAEVEAVYRRAQVLCERAGDDAKRFAAEWGLWYVHFNRGEYDLALGIGERLLEIARQGTDSGQLLEAHHALWPTLTGMGRPLQAIVHAQQGLAIYDPKRHAAYANLYAGHDPGTCCRWHLGMLQWLIGCPDQALRHAHDARRLAEELKHPLSTVISLWFGGWVYYQRGEIETAVATFERLIALAEPHGFVRWMNDVRILLRVLRMRELDGDALGDLHKQLTGVQSANWRQNFMLCAVAELLGKKGYAAQGRAVLKQVPAQNRSTSCASEFLRIEGELLLREGGPPDAAERGLREALALARRRDEKSLELRSAVSLARMLMEQGRGQEALDGLREVYGFFKEGLDTADLRAARAILEGKD